jgi:hypothetical protein
VAFTLCEPLGDEGCLSAHVRSSSSAGQRDWPHLVRWYSTFGGTCAWTMRATMPSRSSCRSLLDQHLLRDGRNRALEIREAQLPPAEEMEQNHELPATFQHPNRMLDPDGRRRGRVLTLTHR